ncbi:MAG: M23 family metallopeptidase [Bacteroidota bacterium]
MKLSRVVLLICIPVLFTSVGFESDSYYLFPIRPGERNYLSGNFCELRSSHLHAGIDIKVGGVVGSPVHATADGFVNRIKISYGGYGNAIYIQHPNGTTSVYAHLHEFNDQIQEFVKKAQYRKKSFTIELFPQKDELKVKRGEVIGKAGNSGSSGGPHLHFEIRDANQQPMDPLKFGFKEIVDNVSPYVRRIALTTLEKDARINGQFGRFEFSLKSQNGKYVVNEPIAVRGTIGVEVAAFDKATGARNVYGVKETELTLDGESQFHCNMEKFSFSQAKNIHVHTNYEERYRQNRTFYKLYVDDGNTLKFYETNAQKGKITINDDQLHQANIVLKDINGNRSQVNFSLQGQPTTDKTLTTRYFNKPYSSKNYHVRGNVLQLFAPVDKNPEGLYQRKLATFFAERRALEEPPAYVVNDVAVYLWDLNRGIPDSVDMCGDISALPIKVKVPSRNAFSFYQPQMNVTFPKSALFDTLFLAMNHEQEVGKELFRIHQDNVPLRQNMQILLKPRQFPDGARSKTSVYRLDAKGDLGYEGGEWKENTISFRTRNFGDFVLEVDTIAPVITPLSISSDRLRFKIEDVTSGIREYEAYVDGEWLLMHYDYKRDLIWSDRLDNSRPLQGEVKLRVTDMVGNENIFTKTIGS